MTKRARTVSLTLVAAAALGASMPARAGQDYERRMLTACGREFHFEFSSLARPIDWNTRQPFDLDAVCLSELYGRGSIDFNTVSLDQINKLMDGLGLTTPGRTRFIIFDNLVDENPSDARSHLYRATNLQALGGSSQDVLDGYSRAIELSPEGWISRLAYEGRAYGYYRQGEKNLAFMDADRLVTSNPQYARGYILRADMYSQLGDIERARADYDRGIALDPDNAENLAYRGAFRWSQHDMDGALADYAESLRLSPDQPMLLLARAQIFEMHDDLPRAEADVDAAIRLKSSTTALLLRARIRLSRDNRVGAIADYTSVLEADQNRSDVLVARGKVYRLQEDWTRAVADFDEAIRLSPTLAEAFRERAIVHEKRNDRPGAIADYTIAIQLEPENSGTFLSRGANYEAQRDWPRAIADYSEAMRLSPRNANTVMYRANAYRASGDATRAIADYTAALAINPRHHFALNGRGLAYDTTGQLELAMADFDQAAAIAPETWNFQTNRCYARARLRADLVAARSACEAAYRLAPQQAVVANSLGVLELQEGRNEEAWAHLDIGVKADATRANRLYGRGIAALRLGRTAEGEADIAAALQLDPKIAETFAGWGIQRP